MSVAVAICMGAFCRRFARAAAILVLPICSAVQAADETDPGRLLFIKDAAPPCAICHTLSDAGATGAIGPSLDELKPDAPRVAKAVKTGLGQMPAYPQLSDDQIQKIASYVTRVAGVK